MKIDKDPVGDKDMPGGRKRIHYMTPSGQIVSIIALLPANCPLSPVQGGTMTVDGQTVTIVSVEDAPADAPVDGELTE